MDFLTTATRRLEFDAGHRVLGHQGKCRHLHGHRYVAEITVQAKELDDLSMVVDFSLIKAKVGEWIDEHWDHNMLLNSMDPILGTKDVTYDLDVLTKEMFGGKVPFIFTAENPTAEVMARELFKVSSRLLDGDGIEVTYVRLYETPNCWADCQNPFA